MKIAVLSGKGGTGKTFVSVNLAITMNDSIYLDCDVEEPNGILYLKPEIIETKTVSVSIPKIDTIRCDGCRKCVDFCAFNALILLDNKAFLSEQLCHSCGGCVLVCPQKAITELTREIGTVTIGKKDSTLIVAGMMNPKEETGVPIIKEVKKTVSNYNDKTVIVDCPPGSGCSVMESIDDADYCVIVTEPTVFGLANLKMIVDLVKTMGIKAGIVINKAQENNDLIIDYCQDKNISLLGVIPFSRELATINNEARIAVKENNKYAQIFNNMLSRILTEAEK